MGFTWEVSTVWEADLFVTFSSGCGSLKNILFTLR